MEMDRQINVFVPGEPQPMAKKLYNRKGKGRLYPRDPRGVIRGWYDEVAFTVQKVMGSQECFGEFEPVVLNLAFYISRPKSVTVKKFPLPSKKPDVDNLAYTVTNALSGIVYWDDSRVVLLQVSKCYADNEHPAGVQILVYPFPEFITSVG